MKRWRMAVVAALVCMVLLAGCAKPKDASPEPGSLAHYLDRISAQGSYLAYFRNFSEYLLDDALFDEALAYLETGDAELRQRIDVVRLLCEMEYAKAGVDEGDAFGFIDAEYPVSRPYVQGLLEGLDLGDEAMWKMLGGRCKLHETDNTYTRFLAVLYDGGRSDAFAKEAGRVVTEQKPENYKTYAVRTAEDMVEEVLVRNEEELPELFEALCKTGFFGGDRTNYTREFLAELMPKEEGDIDENLAFIYEHARAYKPALLKYGDAEKITQVEGLAYTGSGLRLNLEEKGGIDLSFAWKPQISQSGGLQGDIPQWLASGVVEGEDPGGTVLIVQRHLYVEPGSSVYPLALEGNAMIALPLERIPKSLEESDLLLLCDVYYDYFGEYENGTKGMSSKVAGTLYDFKTGETLAHLGTIRIDPPSVKKLGGEKFYYVAPASSERFLERLEQLGEARE